MHMIYILGIAQVLLLNLLIEDGLLKQEYVIFEVLTPQDTHQLNSFEVYCSFGIFRVT